MEDHVYCILSASASDHQHHRVVSDTVRARTGFPLSLANIDGCEDYSFVRGCLMNFPEEVCVAGCQPDRMWFRYRVLDSDGHQIQGNVYWQRHQSPNLPEFTFVAHRGVHYTVIVTVELPSGIECTRAVMLAPVEEEERQQTLSERFQTIQRDRDFRSFLNQRKRDVMQALREHNRRVEQSSEDHDSADADYEGDSLPKPEVSKEQLDRELDEMARERERYYQNSSRETEIVGSTVVGTENDIATLDNNTEGFEYDEQLHEQWWAARWDQLYDEAYEAMQAARGVDVKEHSETPEGVSEESSDEEDPRQLSPGTEAAISVLDGLRAELEAIDSRDLSWRNPEHREELKRRYPAFYEEKERHEREPTTAAARAACRQELAGQW